MGENNLGQLACGTKEPDAWFIGARDQVIGPFKAIKHCLSIMTAGSRLIELEELVHESGKSNFHRAGS